MQSPSTRQLHTHSFVLKLAMEPLKLLQLVLWSECVRFVLAAKNNACRSFADYYNDFQNNRHCFYNPDVDLTVPQIIKRNKYPIEIHYATTEDGYILTVFRIPHGKRRRIKKSKGPVFVQHGIVVNSASFVNRGPKSLAFILADKGYDVWLGNFRGTKYSRNHKTLSTSDRKYWNFTFHEHGVYDLPAQINLVSKISNKQIIYIGHSMGTTSGLIYGITYPDETLKKIKLFVDLAPIAFIRHTKTIAKYLVPAWPSIKTILENNTSGSIDLHQQPLAQFCLPYPHQMLACDSFNMIFNGFDYPQEDPETLPASLMQNLDEICIKSVDHYIQIFSSDQFQYYDYGTFGNIKAYNSTSPPIYNISRLAVPHLLVRGKNDFLATKKDVDRLAALLPARAKFNPSMYVIKYDKFSHQDFFTAKDAVPLCYNKLLNILRDA